MMNRFRRSIFGLVLVFLAACQQNQPLSPVTVTVAEPAAPTLTSTPEPSPTPSPEPPTIMLQPGRLYAGPANMGFQVLAELPAGEQVTPIGAYGDFVEISSGEQMKGYVLREQLANLPETM
jgi:hypothetical protein